MTCCFLEMDNRLGLMTLPRSLSLSFIWLLPPRGLKLSEVGRYARLDQLRSFNSHCINSSILIGKSGRLDLKHGVLFVDLDQPHLIHLASHGQLLQLLRISHHKLSLSSNRYIFLNMVSPHQNLRGQFQFGETQNHL